MQATQDINTGDFYHFGGEKNTAQLYSCEVALKEQVMHILQRMPICPQSQVISYEMFSCVHSIRFHAVYAEQYCFHSEYCIF